MLIYINIRLDIGCLILGWVCHVPPIYLEIFKANGAAVIKNLILGIVGHFRKTLKLMLKLTST